MTTRFCKIEKEGIIQILLEVLESAGLKTGEELEVSARRGSLVLTKKGLSPPSCGEDSKMYQLLSNDATHIALMAKNGIQAMASFDHDLERVELIKVYGQA
jgi:predicted nucleic acid-binding protein